MSNGKLSYEVEFTAKGIDEVQSQAAAMKASLGGEGGGASSQSVDPLDDLRGQLESLRQRNEALKESTAELKAMEAAAGGANKAMLFGVVATSILMLGQQLEAAADSAALLTLELEKMAIARDRTMADFAASLPKLEFRDDVTDQRQSIARQMEDLAIAMDEQEIRAKPQTWLGKSFAGLEMLKDTAVRGLATGDFSLRDEAGIRLAEMRKQYADLQTMMNEMDFADQQVAMNPKAEKAIASAEQFAADQRILRKADENPQAALDLLDTRYSEMQDTLASLEVQYRDLEGTGSKAALEVADAMAALMKEMVGVEAQYDAIIRKQQQKQEQEDREKARDAEKLAKEAERAERATYGRLSMPSVATYALREIGGTVGDPGRAGVGRDDPRFFQDQALQALRNIEAAIKENRNQNYAGLRSRGWED